MERILEPVLVDAAAAEGDGEIFDVRGKIQKRKKDSHDTMMLMSGRLTTEFLALKNGTIGTYLTKLEAEIKANHKTPDQSGIEHLQRSARKR